MPITIIGCPFKTSYGAATEALRKALEKRTGKAVAWVASNCGCGDQAEIDRQFQMPGCTYFEMYHISRYPSRQRWKNWVKSKARNVLAHLRARRYGKLSAGAEVVNFQQTLYAFGSSVLFQWLHQPSSAARVVTVHELDREQLQRPADNKTYNLADAIIVPHGAMKDQLIGLGVDPNKIEIVVHGTDLPVLEEKQPREGIVYYAAHHPLAGKGLHAVLAAMALLKTRLGSQAPKLKVHGYFSVEDLAVVKDLAAEAGLANDVSWFVQIPMAEALRLYQSSLLCLLPFTGSSAGLAAATAAAAGLPVIATRNAGIPEHLGENVLWLERDNAAEIVQQVETLLSSAELRRDLSGRLRQRARQYLSWDVVAEKTLAVYERALRRKRNHSSVRPPALALEAPTS